MADALCTGLLMFCWHFMKVCQIMHDLVYETIKYDDEKNVLHDF